MAALDTAGDYEAAARYLLQDTATPFRYPEAQIFQNLNIALQELVRLRPDAVFKLLRTGATFPSAAVDADPIAIDMRFRMPVLYLVVGLTQLSDNEEAQDGKASALLQRFAAQLIGVTA